MIGGGGGSMTGHFFLNNKSIIELAVQFDQDNISDIANSDVDTIAIIDEIVLQSISIFILSRHSLLSIIMTRCIMIIMIYTQHVLVYWTTLALSHSH